jgi:Flp pilus assembly protein TadB
MFERALFTVSRLSPRGVLNAVRRELTHANVDMNENTFVGLTIIAGVASAVLSIYALPVLFPIDATVAAIAGFVATVLLAYTLLTYLADQRIKKLESQLPDALVLIASNIRAGATIDKAMVAVARHAEDPMKTELDRTIRDLVSNKTLEISLKDWGNRSGSNVLRNTIDLLLFALRGGGQVQDIMLELANEIRMTQTLQQEVDSQINLYKMFLILIVIFIAPVMLAVATNFLMLTNAFKSKLGESLSEGSVSAGRGGVGSFATTILQKIQTPDKEGITPDDLKVFAYVLITASSFVVAFLLGVIESGNARSGLKYAPVFVIIAWIIFYFVNVIAQMFLKQMFSGVLGGGEGEQAAEAVS